MDWECTSSVWPPDTSNEKKGKLGWTGTICGSARAETRRGVKAWACMWFTPTRGIPHATARPLAVSMPVARQDNIPGPRVTDMKSGFFLAIHVPLARTEIARHCSSMDDSLGGRLCSDFAIKTARFCLWDRLDTMG